MTVIRRAMIMLMSSIVAGTVNAAAAFDHTAWNYLLQKNVHLVRSDRGSEVDYDGMLRERAKLDRYLARAAAVSAADFDRWDPAGQLAFLINIYNAATIRLVLSAYPGIHSMKDLGSLWRSPWKLPIVTVLGETRSLDSVEHELILDSGRYRDPRVHFALNCASQSCPALRSEAYEGDLLDQQLEDQVERFLGDRNRNYVLGSELRISPIFKWYRRDFESGWHGVRRLNDFLLRYALALGLNGLETHALDSGAIEVTWLDYDWSLNASH